MKPYTPPRLYELPRALGARLFSCACPEGRGGVAGAGGAEPPAGCTCGWPFWAVDDDHPPDCPGCHAASCPIREAGIRRELAVASVRRGIPPACPAGLLGRSQAVITAVEKHREKKGSEK